ncbi:hypothetical protein Q3G72_001840 [Acer saccharum]|nr:hypothetical protein Q3G72_001840 [Acer saccharum]
MGRVQTLTRMRSGYLTLFIPRYLTLRSLSNKQQPLTTTALPTFFELPPDSVVSYRLNDNETCRSQNRNRLCQVHLKQDTISGNRSITQNRDKAPAADSNFQYFLVLFL